MQTSAWQMTAHHEWASRPVDQRFQDIAALHAAVLRRRTLSQDIMLDAGALRIAPSESTGLELLGAGARFSHWAFGQAAGLGKSPAGFLRDLPKEMAADILNHRLGRFAKGKLKLLVSADPDGQGARARAFLTEKYGRIWDDDVVRAVRRIVDGTSWTNPLGYKDGRWGAERVPSGLYASEQDVFMFFVDLEHPIEVRGERLFRGFIIKNSEVGAGKCKGLAFLFREVCGNNIIHGGELLLDFDIVHLGDAMKRFSMQLEPALEKYITSPADTERVMIEAAMDRQVAKNDEEARKWLTDRKFTKQEAERGVEAAVREEGSAGNVWNLVQGLTALAREKANADDRVDLETRAGRLLVR